MNSCFLTFYFTFVLCTFQEAGADHGVKMLFNDTNFTHIFNNPRFEASILNNSRLFKELALLNFYTANGAPRLDGECMRHQQMVKDGVENNEEWALRYLDASSKWTNGFMTGNLIQLGSFDECLALRSPYYAFRGQHCHLYVDFHAEGLNFTPPVDPMVTMMQNKYNEKKLVQWTVCMPSTCEADRVKSQLLAEFNEKFPNNGLIGVELENCFTSQDRPPFTVADYVAIFIFSFICLIAVFSTVYDLMTLEADQRWVVLTSFSLYANGRVLLSPAVDVLPALHGVRVLTRIWDQIGKLYTAENLSPAVNLDVLQEYYSDWPHVFSTNPSFAIDSISFLSGCLVGFNFMKERTLGIRFYLSHFYFKRYVRFTCPYAAMVLLQSTLFIHLDSGPVWVEKVTPLQERCQESWYTGIIYLNNYLMSDKQCLSQGWFNCAEMQMFWLSPLLLFPLWKRPFIGKLLIVVLVLLGIVITFVVAYVYEVPVGNMSPNDKGALVFWPTHTRYPSWIIGLLTGCLLQDAETSREELSPGLVRIGWAVSMALILLPIVGSHAFQERGAQYNRIVDSLFISVTRPAFTIGLSFVVYACITGHGGPVNTILTWSFFRVTSRVMYSFYLTHTTVLFYLAARARTPIYITDTTLLGMEISYFFITWACSVLLCLMFEMPFVIVENHFLGKTGHPKPKHLSSMLRAPSSGSQGILRRPFQRVDRELGDVATSSSTMMRLQTPSTSPTSLGSLENSSTAMLYGSERDNRLQRGHPSIADNVRRQWSRVTARRELTDDNTGASVMQLRRQGSTHQSKARLTSEEVEARKQREDALRQGTDMEVLEQEDGNLKQLQRSKKGQSAVKLRLRREDHARGTADLDVYENYSDEKELEEEEQFLRASHTSELLLKSRSVVRFTADEQVLDLSRSNLTLRSDSASKKSTTRLTSAAPSEVDITDPSMHDVAGPSGVNSEKKEEERKKIERVKWDEEMTKKGEEMKSEEDMKMKEEDERRKKEGIAGASEIEKENQAEEEEPKKEEDKKSESTDEENHQEDRPPDPPAGPGQEPGSQSGSS